jgi:hypothetical protein
MNYSIVSLDDFENSKVQESTFRMLQPNTAAFE